jgi:hypothetical protein
MNNIARSLRIVVIKPFLGVAAAAAPVVLAVLD